MNNELVFCEVCRDEVDYIVEKKEMTGTIRGIQYRYDGEAAKCSICGALLDVEKISESNLEALYDVYRKENGIVTLDKIKALPKLYSIGTRPLSRLLGWGEHTFSRYYDGDIPTKQYSEILNRLYEDPKYYLNILTAHKERLSSNKTYEKSRKAAEALIYTRDNSRDKISIAALYVLNQCGDITPLALQKALYYIQGFYYAFYKKFIFSDDCEAWTHGPVYRDIYSRYKDFHYSPIQNGGIFKSSVFTTEEKVVMDSVIKNICCYSGRILESFTHNESPWITTRGELGEEESSNRIISKDLIGDYFLKIKEKYAMCSPGDIRQYARDMFEKI